MAELQVIARYYVKAGHEEEVQSLLPLAAEASREEPGNLAYDAYAKLGVPGEIVLLERYTSREALDAHRETPHFREIVAGKIIPLLDRREVELYDVAE